jgi:tRNA-specific adenosine deaminase 3
MALLHSRVKEIIYLMPMEKTGGCGGLACLPKLEGVNHRFGILKWKEGDFGIENLHLDPIIDA